MRVERISNIVQEMRFRVKANEGAGIHPGNCKLYTDWADRIEAAWHREVNGLQEKMRKIVMQMQMEKGDVQKCEECHKKIAWDEYAVNFGLCDDCLNKHLKEDGLI